MLPEDAPKPSSKKADRYATNLASEFYALSVLHRLGADATLTLGNKKAVDIVVVRREGQLITVDVKGVASKSDWPADNVSATPKTGHFLVLVSYEGRFADVTQLPSVWVVPHETVSCYMHQAKARKGKARRFVTRSQLIHQGQEFRNAWHLILGAPDPNDEKPSERSGGKHAKGNS